MFLIFFSFVHVVIVPTTKPTTRPILTPSIQTVATTTPTPTTERALSTQPVTTKGSTIPSVTTKGPTTASSIRTTAPTTLDGKSPATTPSTLETTKGPSTGSETTESPSTALYTTEGLSTESKTTRVSSTALPVTSEAVSTIAIVTSETPSTLVTTEGVSTSITGIRSTASITSQAPSQTLGTTEGLSTISTTSKAFSTVLPDTEVFSTEFSLTSGTSESPSTIPARTEVFSTALPVTTELLSKNVSSTFVITEEISTNRTSTEASLTTKEILLTTLQTTEGPVTISATTEALSTASPVATEDISTAASTTTFVTSEGPSAAETPSQFVTVEGIPITNVTTEVPSVVSLSTEGRVTAMETTEGPSTMSVTSTAYSSPSPQATEDLSTEVSTTKFVKSKGPSTALPVTSEAPSTLVTVEGLSTTNVTAEFRSIAPLSTERPLTTIETTEGPSSSGTTMAFSEGSTTVSLETTEASELETTEASEFETTEVFLTANVTKAPSTASLTKEGPATAFETTEGPLETPVPSRDISTALPMTTEALSTKASKTTVEETIGSSTALPATTEVLSTVSILTTETPSTFVTTEEILTTYITEEVSPSASLTTEGLSTKLDTMPFTTEGFSTAPPVRTGAPSTYVTTDGLSTASLKVGLPTFETTEGLPLLYETTKSPIVSSVATKGPSSTLGTTEELSVELETSEGLSTASATTVTSSTIHVTTKGSSAASVTKEGSSTILFATETPSTADITTEAPSQTSISADVFSTRLKTTAGPSTTYVTTEADFSVPMTTEGLMTSDATTESPSTMLATTSASAPNDTTRLPPGPIEQQPTVTTESKGITFHASTDIASPVRTEEGDKKKITKTDSYPNTTATTMTAFAQFTTLDLNETDATQRSVTTLPPSVEDVTVITSMETEVQTEEPITSFSPIIQQTSKNITTIPDQEAVTPSLDTTTADILETGYGTSSTVTSKQGTTIGYKTRSFPKVTDEVTGTTVFTTEGITSGVSDTTEDATTQYQTSGPSLSTRWTGTRAMINITKEDSDISLTSPEDFYTTQPTTFISEESSGEPTTQETIYTTSAKQDEEVTSSVTSPTYQITTEQVTLETGSGTTEETPSSVLYTVRTTSNLSTIERSSSPEVTLEMSTSTLGEVTDAVTGTTALTSEGTTAAFSPATEEVTVLYQTSVPILSTIKAVDISETVSDEMYTTDMPFTSPATLQETTIEYKTVTSPKVTTRVLPTTFPQVTDEVTVTTALTPEGTPSGAEPPGIIGTTEKAVDISETVSDEMYTTDELMPFTSPTTPLETTIEYKTLTSPQVTTRVFPTTFPQVTDEVTDTTTLSPEGTPSGSEPQKIIGTTITTVDISETVSDEMYTTDMPFTSPATLQETTIEYKTVTSPKVTTKVLPTTFPQVTDEVTDTTALTPEGTPSGAEPPGIIGTTEKAVDISETVSDEMYTTDELMPFTSPTTPLETTIEYKTLTSPQVTTRVFPTTFPQVTDEVTDTTTLSPEGTPSGSEPQKIIGTTITTVDISETVSDEMYTTDMPFTSPATLQETTIEYKTVTSPKVTTKVLHTTFPQVTDEVTDTTALTPEGTPSGAEPPGIIGTTEKAVDISETVSDEMYTTDELMPFTSPTTPLETTIEYKTLTSPQVTTRVFPTTFPQVTDEVTDTTALTPEGTPSGAEPPGIIGTTEKAVDISETVSDEMYTTDMPFTSPATLQETTIEFKTVTSPKVTTKVLPTTFSQVTDEVTDTTALTPEGTPSGAEPPGIIGTTVKAVDISETVSDEMYTTDELMPFTSPATLQETTIEYRTSTSPKATSRVPPTTLQQVTDEFTGTTALTLEGTPSGAEPREMIRTTVETVSDDMYTTDELMLFTSPATIQETTIEYEAITSPKITSRVPTTTFPQVTDAITDTTALTPEGTPSGSEPQKIIGTTIKVVDISVSDEMYTTDELMPFTLPTTLQETTIEYKTVTSPKVATRVFPTTFPQGTDEVTDTTALSPEGTPSGAEPPGIIGTTVKAVDISETVSDEMYTTDELMPFTSPTTLQETTIEYKAITSPKVTGTVPLTSEGIPSGYSQATEEVTVFYQTSVPTLSSSGAEPPGIIGTTVKAVDISETVSDEMYSTDKLIEYKTLTSPQVTTRGFPTTFPQVTDEVTDTTLSPEGTPSGSEPQKIIGTTITTMDISETVSDEMYTTDELMPFTSPTTLQETTIEYKAITSPNVTSRVPPTTFPQVTDEVTDTTTLTPEGTPSGDEPQKIIGTTIKAVDMTVFDEMYTTDELIYASPTTLQETTIEYKTITTPTITSKVPPTTFPQVTDEVRDTTALTPEGTPSGDEPQKFIGTTIKAVDISETVSDEMYTTDELMPFTSPVTLQETTIEYKTITSPKFTDTVPLTSEGIPSGFSPATEEVTVLYQTSVPTVSTSGAEPPGIIGTTVKAVDISETVSNEMYTTEELMPFTTLQESTTEYQAITSPKVTSRVPPTTFPEVTDEVTDTTTLTPEGTPSGDEPQKIKAVDMTVFDEMYTTDELIYASPTTLQETTIEYKAITSPKVTSRVPPTTFPQVTDDHRYNSINP